MLGSEATFWSAAVGSPRLLEEILHDRTAAQAGDELRVTEPNAASQGPVGYQGDPITMKAVLNNLRPARIDSLRLFILYLLIFLAAEAAFLLMALKEYLQDVLQLSDRQILLEELDVVEVSE